MYICMHAHECVFVCIYVSMNGYVHNIYRVNAKDKFRIELKSSQHKAYIASSKINSTFCIGCINCSNINKMFFAMTCKTYYYCEKKIILVNICISSLYICIQFSAWKKNLACLDILSPSTDRTELQSILVYLLFLRIAKKIVCWIGYTLSLQKGGSSTHELTSIL